MSRTIKATVMERHVNCSGTGRTCNWRSLWHANSMVQLKWNPPTQASPINPRPHLPDPPPPPQKRPCVTAGGLNGRRRNRYNSITYEMSLLQVNFKSHVPFCKFGSAVCVRVCAFAQIARLVQERWQQRVSLGEGGHANLRGLIMTPRHSPQELPSLAHHFTCTP